jgi:hypothetical protein
MYIFTVFFLLLLYTSIFLQERERERERDRDTKKKEMFLNPEMLKIGQTFKRSYCQDNRSSVYVG